MRQRDCYQTAPLRPMLMKSPIQTTVLLATLLFSLLALPSALVAQEAADAPSEQAESMSVDERIDEMMAVPTKLITNIIFYSVEIKDDVDVPLVLVWLGFAAIFFTFFFKFINFRAFKTALQTVGGRYTSKDDPGEITHFQALTAALSGTVGLGNIAGVAIAIQLGGPGATFWMIAMGFFGMTSKFVECTLGVRYRDFDENGRVLGGPMRYLSKGLRERGLGQLGLLLAILFAVMCVGGSIGGGNLFQIKNATDLFVSSFCGEGSVLAFLDAQRWIFGMLIAIVVAAVIIGGIRSIARVTAKLVPIMCAIYILAIIVVLTLHASDLRSAFANIVSKAFQPDSFAGGLIGCMLMGIQRAAFSNEAGIGSAAIAHSAVKTSKPASEGLVALLEPFVDTVVVCTMTALAIVVTGTYQMDGGDIVDSTKKGVLITSAAFETVIPWFKYILALAVTLFAFSTMISWSYYGIQAWSYLFGKSKFMDLAYKVLFCAFIVIGSSMSLGKVVQFSDAMLFAMAIPNIIGLYLLLPVVRRELADYLAHCKEIDSQP